MKETLSNATDEVLLQRVWADRDAGAFEVFAQRHKQAMYNLALQLATEPMLAEDIVQETLLSLWSAAGNYDAKKGSARAWLLHITVHQTIKMRGLRQRQDSRVRKRWVRNGFPSLVALPDARSAEDRETMAALQGLLRQLTDTDRHLVTLYYGGECSQDMIAQLLGVPQRTVSRARVAKGKRYPF